MSAPGGAAPDAGWATIPNAISLLRLLLLAPICVLLVREGPDTLSVVLLLCWALTDWVDGFLARRLGQVSRIGEALDPVADRIGLVGIVLSLALVSLVPWVALVVIAVVDVVVLLGSGASALRESLGVSWVGKARTAILMTSVFLLAAASAWWPDAVAWCRALLWLGTGLHVIAGAGYLLTAWRRRRAGRAGAAAEAPASRP